jgi:hypothetical protein
MSDEANPMTSNEESGNKKSKVGIRILIYLRNKSNSN